MARFGAVLTAMVTPFDEDGRLALDVAADLARWLVANGSDGLVIAGSTGESPTITKDEHLDLLRAVRTAVDAPVVAGVGSNDTASAVGMGRAAAKIGVDGLLSVTPYYNRPDQQGLYDHFRVAAGATDLPVMLYDIPVRTGRKIATDTLLRLFRDVPNIVALKDASGDPAETARVHALAGAAVDIYSGDDALTLPLLAVGATGAVSVASHWAGPEISQMIAAFQKGDHDLAQALNQRLQLSYDFESTDLAPNPIPSKAMMRTLGLAVGQCRPPLGRGPADIEDDARAVFAQLRSGVPSGDEAGA